MKLQLKYLAPYLPYGLRLYTGNYFKNIFLSGLFRDKKGREHFLIKELKLNNDPLIDSEFNTMEYKCPIYSDIKGYPKKPIYLPLLHPLSDLTKEIEHNGEKFNPKEKLYDLLTINPEWFKYELLEKGDLNEIKYLPYGMVQKLHEWHFDTEELIKNNLAIDINTLIENPYK